MRKCLLKFLNRIQLRILRSHKVVHFDDIGVVDLRNKSPHFHETIMAALQLIKDTDFRRFCRVKGCLDWIINCTLSQPNAGATYHHDIRSCEIDFVEPTSDADTEFSIGWYARTLIHEATHGAVAARGIHYNRILRERIEQLCVTEEQRFLLRLGSTKPQLAKSLYREFDASLWERSWNTTWLKRFGYLLRSLFSR